MMNNITFEPLKDIDLQYACQLYEEAFPIEERRDTSEWLLQNEQNPLFNILCIKQDQTFQGILSYWTFESFHYIEHFAISPQQRVRTLHDNTHTISNHSRSRTRRK